jgi:hypothetical protein
MGLSSSATLLYLPGQDANQQAQMTVALNTNANILSILTSSAAASGTAAAITTVAGIQSQVGSIATQSTTLLPQVESLPTFGTFSNYQNTPGYVVYDSEMQPIHSSYLTTNSEIGQAFTGYNYTTGNIGSNGVTTNWVSATPYTQADGNWLVSIPTQIGSFNNGMYGISHDAVDSPYPRFGIMLGKTGIRQKWSLYTSDSNVAIYPFGQISPYEYIGINNGIYSTWYGGNAYGSIGYNDRTQTLVLLEGKDNNNNYRLHIWRNTNVGRSLNDPNMETGRLNQFLVEAKTAGAAGTGVTMTSATGVFYTYNDFQWQANGSQNYTESRYRMRVFPADNGTIGMMRFVPSTGTYAAQFTPIPGQAGTYGTLNTSYNGVGTTTSYGIDQGNKYGMRHMQTWDNNWVAAYAPYYYYGSGMCGFFMNTVDPTKYYNYQYSSTTNGCQLVPFKEDKFLFNDSQQNADGNVGMRLWVQDVGGWAKNGVQWNLAAIANGAGVGLTNPPTMQYAFDTRFTSTNYPLLMSPRHWTNG